MAPPPRLADERILTIYHRCRWFALGGDPALVTLRQRAVHGELLADELLRNPTFSPKVLPKWMRV